MLVSLLEKPTRVPLTPRRARGREVVSRVSNAIKSSTALDYIRDVSFFVILVVIKSSFDSPKKREEVKKTVEERARTSHG